MKLVNARLLQRYDKENTVGNYYGIEVYSHPIIKTAVDRVLLSNSTPHRYLPDENERVRPETSVWLDNQNGRFGEEKVFCTVWGNQSRSYRR